jgi:hypothetical protein
MPATTFDPGVKTNTNLTGGNLIATSTGAGGARSSRFLQGLTYFELTPTTLTGTPSLGIATSNWNTSTALQSGLNSLAYLPSGAVQVNGVTLATITAWAQGSRIDVAVDPADHLIWFRVGGGNWNNSGTADPATLAGGIDYGSAITQLGTLAAAIYASLTGNVWTGAFSAASFAGTPPAGYSSLDNVLLTAGNNVDVFYEAMPLVAPTFTIAAKAHPLPQDRYQRLYSGSGPSQTVSGTVLEYGSPVAGRRVDVYDRNTGDLTRHDGQRFGRNVVSQLPRPGRRPRGLLRPRSPSTRWCSITSCRCSANGLQPTPRPRRAVRFLRSALRRADSATS